jgi:hypothetical protein
MRHRYVREVLSERLADAPASRIDHRLGPELAEGLDDIARIARAAAPYLQKAAPGILQGAATGFLTGGPIGALVGGAAGGVSSLGARPAPGVSPQAPQAGANPAVANPAALQLVATLLRPEVIDALMAMALGAQGAKQVPIAGANVPVGQVANLIQSLAERAVASHPPTEAIPAYLADAAVRGENIAMPHVRADALHALVREAWEADESFGEDIDEEAEARDLEDIYRLGGLG